jgi:hypothetical protein
MRSTIVVAFALLTIACGPDPKPAPAAAPQQKAAVKVADESRKFPITNLVETKVIDRELMGKTFMPGGTIAHYKRAMSNMICSSRAWPMPMRLR